MISFHSNNTFAEKRGIAKNLLLGVRSVMHQLQVDLVAGNFNGVHGASSRAAMLGPSAVLKKHSSIRACRRHPAPHHSGDQGACQMNGRMCVSS